MYQFKCVFYDEVNLDSRTESGIVSAGSYSSAMDKLSDYYGEDNLHDVRLTYISENDVITFNDSNFNLIPLLNDI